MRALHIRRLLSSALGLIVLGCLWFYLAPVSIGGSTTYVVTHGISMQPRFHTGDLAIVRSQSSYKVGEVAAYNNKMLHTVVVHRIVGREGNRYLFKGDNNNFVDFEHPQASQLIGSLWLHLPGAGAELQSLHSPLLIAGLVTLAVLLFGGGAFTRRRRRRGRQRRSEGNTRRISAPRHGPADPVLGVAALGFVALLPFVALALLAFTRPTGTRTSAKIAYKQSGNFSYSANSTPGPAYPGNHAVTGDPIFTHVIDSVDLSFAYQFETAVKHSLTGKASLMATLASTSGWKSTFPLGPPTYFHGDHGVASATLDLRSLLALMHSVEATTQVNGSYTLTITPHVTTSGHLQLVPLQATFAPAMLFTLSELELQPASASGTASGGSVGAGKSTPSQFTPSSSGSVAGSRYEPLDVSLGFARLSISSARTIALAAIAILTGALLAILFFIRPLLAKLRPRRRDQSADIVARYGDLIVPVAHVWQLPGVAVIDVSDMDALARIAQHYDRSILHEQGAQGDVFWVTDESGQFRYAAAAAAPIGNERVPEVAATQPLTPDAYAQELELGRAISAYEAQPAPAPVAAEPSPAAPVAAHAVAVEPVTAEWIAPEPIVIQASAEEERWMAANLADALIQEPMAWSEPEETADPSPTRAGAFARVAGLGLSREG